MQLDNTSNDNKNHTIFGFLAWLVAEGHFAGATVSFLPVGQTHEDIDALFGVVVRYLRKFPVTFTHTDLMKQIDESLGTRFTCRACEGDTQLEYLARRSFH